MCDCLFTSNRKEKVFVIIICIFVYNIKNYIYVSVKVHVITGLSVFYISNQYVVKWAATEKLKM